MNIKNGDDLMSVFIKKEDLSENGLTYQDFKDIEDAASKGDPYGMTKMGCFYMFGQFVEKDEDKALQWFLKAGKLGDANAQWSVGDIYKHGTKTMDPNPELSARWFRYAAHTEPNGRNLRSYGECLEEGFGVMMDPAEAAEYYERAIGFGDIEAFFRLGLLLFEGRGVERDINRGLSYIYTAKMNESAGAKYIWDKLEEQGLLKGVKKEKKRT